MARIHWSDLLLAEFKHWDLYLHNRQDPYLGAAYVWPRKPQMHYWASFYELPSAMHRELFDVIVPAHHDAAQALGNMAVDSVECLMPWNAKYDCTPYALLIPRRSAIAFFDGWSFHDKHHGTPYDRSPRGQTLPKDKLLSVRQKMIDELSQLSAKSN